jgi:hypothetical protein
MQSLEGNSLGISDERFLSRIFNIVKPALELRKSDRRLVLQSIARGPSTLLINTAAPGRESTASRHD